MAVFQPILGNLLGSIGANTFSRNRGGSIVRRRVKPVNTLTARRTQSRQAFQSAVNAWSIQTDDQIKTAWEAYALGTPVPDRWGSNTFRTGREWFIAVNAYRLNALFPVDLIPPQTPGTAEAFDYTLLSDVAGGLVVDTAFGNLQVGDIFQLQISIPFAATRLKFNSNPVETVITLGSTLVGQVLKLPGTVADGQVYFVLASRLDAFGKLSLAPVQKRILTLP